MIGTIALFMMGPYTYCSGVMAMNLGGKRAAAASAGIIDVFGYMCGAIISGEVGGYLVKKHGFAPLLDVLFWVGAATVVIAIVYWVQEEKRFRTHRP
jgi:OPA family glycerol-3-phosphate transporter-like MFS transporter